MAFESADAVWSEGHFVVHFEIFAVAGGSVDAGFVGGSGGGDREGAACLGELSNAEHFFFQSSKKC